MFPITITRSGLVLEVKGNKSLVSYSFMARFLNGRVKLINRTSWVLNSLLKGEEDEKTPVEIPMNRDECILFYKNWENLPMRARWETDYQLFS